MPRYKITLEYDGSRYAGWQMQKNERTIQGMLLNAAMETFRTEDVDIQGSGRTDAGVHALGQVAHMDVDSKLTLQAIANKLNYELPYDINVLKVEKAPNTFNARHDAVARSYIYQLSTRRTAFGKHYCWWVRDPMRIEALEKAAKLFSGMHDFRSFTDDAGEQTSTKVELKKVEVLDLNGLVLLHFVGSHFLWKMVRRLTGVMVQAGMGVIDERRIDSYLKEHSKEPATFTAPPSGLYLHKIYYPGDATDYSLTQKDLTLFPNALWANS